MHAEFNEMLPAEADVVLPSAPTSMPTDLFGTEHLRGDLKGRSVRGGAITLTSQGVKFVLGLVATMVLARLLNPAEFGVFGMVTPITGFIGIFKDLGLSLATVQREHITHEQVSTLFWVNVSMSVLLAAITAAISPFVGWFYGDPRTMWVTLASAGVFIFGGLTAQHSALLSRNMRFGAIAIADICTVATAVIVGSISAWLGWSYWSLVFMTLAGGFVNCLVIWLVNPWRPGPPRRGVGTRDLLKFGTGMTVTNVVAYLTTQIDRVAIGRFYWPSANELTIPANLVSIRAASVGIYSRAQSLFVAPVIQLMVPLNSVMVPLFSRLANDRAKLGAVAAELAELAAALTLPLALISFLCTSELVHIFLGPNPQWVAAIPIAKAFSLIPILLPLGMVVQSALTATGRSDVLVKWELCWAVVLISSIIVGLHWGLVGVALCTTTGWVAVTPIYFYIGYRVAHLRWERVGIAFLRSCVSAAACIVTGYVLHVALQGRSDILRVAVIGASIIMIHGTFMWAFGVVKRAVVIVRSVRK